LSDLHCPGLGCHGKMVTEAHSDIVVDRCIVCRALWFDAHELDRWFALEHPDETVDLEAHIPKRGLSSRNCPRCSREMESAGWPAALLGRCPLCRGLFVEGAVLDQLLLESHSHGQTEFESKLRDAMVDIGWTLLSANGILVLLMRFL
jgi:Zn-finger nucleic acid-binding protein